MTRRYLQSFLTFCQAFLPYINAVNHGEEIVNVDAYGAVETLLDAEDGVGDHLRKTESVGRDLALCSQADGADTQTAADQGKP